MSNNTALMDLLFGQARQAVLAVLLLQPEASFHLRELARLTGSHAGTLGRELEKLVAAGLVLRREQGNQMRYQADRACALYGELAAMFRKTHGAVPVLRDALAPLAPAIRAAWIFGSVARGAEVAGSDVDLFVIGDAGFADVVRAIHPAQAELGREINPVVYSAAEFRRKLAAGDAFARQLLDGPKLMVIGDKDDIGESAGDPPAAAAHG
ncbi:nucleotidyltransferase domain-containing protein [Luteimonas sp. RD2P54]|uniref:Nucleotidyltransferase domain-containing protein n=1 Tax=Luteimonas endophytica TaxID=3042023 RepID=A0ABT6J4H5_9GAMM|nr:nucleotidyltransferase domain-containing protein [Luteimonas endophytica]MDH5821721.1 nucleotidyltransferase domain-containing protein [Luteimonas endophytica]